MSDWKAEIVRIAYWKQQAAEHDKAKSLPWHPPRVAASKKDIFDAEKVTKCRFPSAYKEFLQHANGWKGFLVSTDLFGTGEFCSGRAEKVLDRAELVDFMAEQGFARDSYVAIGSSEVGLEVFILISEDCKNLPGGVIWFDSDEIDRFQSFTEFFSSMVNYNAQVANEMKKIPLK